MHENSSIHCIQRQCDILLSIANFISAYDLSNSKNFGFMLIISQCLEPLLEISNVLESADSNKSFQALRVRLCLYENMLSQIKSLFFVSSRAVNFLKTEINAMNLNLKQKTVLLRKLSDLLENNKILSMSISHLNQSISSLSKFLSEGDRAKDLNVLLDMEQCMYTLASSPWIFRSDIFMIILETIKKLQSQLLDPSTEYYHNILTEYPKLQQLVATYFPAALGHCSRLQSS
jgi:hypothetical protein